MAEALKQLTPKQFPRLLREIPDAPKKLFVRGELPSDTEYKLLAIVGSRAISSYGKQVCEYLIEGLRGYPIVIVSGLAYGVDALAHKTALNVELPCIGVPGSGLGWDVLYPRANVGLAKEIIKAGGALLSEFEENFKATDYSFPQRNRIMAGMSHATLLVEAKERSGTLITARLATEYNRELLVVPGSIFSEQSKGTHQFLKLGAIPVTEPEDILKALGIEAREVPSAASRADLSDAERRVIAIIQAPCTRDELLAQLKLPITEANIILSTMEIKGLISETYGLIRAK